MSFKRDSMKVRIKRIDKDLPLPAYETSGAVGFDILSREDTIIDANSVGKIPGNLVVEVPRGYALIIASRSSTPKKKSLSTPHGIGVIDQDYNGPQDELLVQVYNFSDSAVEVKRGEKIAQGIFVKVDNAEWEESDVLGERTRGGFGSTG
jgi:dUTP pyrophosphatase